jgi:hypothetical protein
MEVGDYWKHIGHVYPRRINGLTKLFGRTLKVNFHNSDVPLNYSYVIKVYDFYKKSDDKARRIINTGEVQLTEIPIFSGMPSATDVVLLTIVPYILTVVLIALVVGLIVALQYLLMWFRS